MGYNSFYGLQFVSMAFGLVKEVLNKLCCLKADQLPSLHISWKWNSGINYLTDLKTTGYCIADDRH